MVKDRKRKRIADFAKEWMLANNHNVVMHGDSSLLHCIAGHAGMKHDGLSTEISVLASLERAKDIFVKEEIYRTRYTYWRSYRIIKEDTDEKKKKK